MLSGFFVTQAYKLKYLGKWKPYWLHLEQILINRILWLFFPFVGISSWGYTNRWLVISD